MKNEVVQQTFQQRNIRQEMIARLAREMTAILDPAEILRYTAQILRDKIGYAYVHFLWWIRQTTSWFS